MIVALDVLRFTDKPTGATITCGYVPRAGQHGEELPRDGNIFGVALLTIEAGIFAGQRHHH